MSDDFRANCLAQRWQVFMMLVLLMIACSLCDPNCDPDDPNNLFCIASGEELNIKQTQQAETEAAYPGSEDEKVDSRYLELKAEADRINNAIFELGGQNKPIPVSMENRLNEIEREMKEWRNWKKYHNQPTPIPAGTMEPKPMQAPALQAQSPDNPPALYADEPSEPIFFIGNNSKVENGATTPSTFSYTPHNEKQCKLEKITTYHWNDGKGVTPGKISLGVSDGTVHGPWQARGEIGQGGVPNAYWVVNVDITLRGNVTYTVIDSDPGTWSQNKATNGMGMTWGDGRCSSDGDGF